MAAFCHRAGRRFRRQRCQLGCRRRERLTCRRRQETQHLFIATMRSVLFAGMFCVSGTHRGQQHWQQQHGSSKWRSTSSNWQRHRRHRHRRCASALAQTNVCWICRRRRARCQCRAVLSHARVQPSDLHCVLPTGKTHRHLVRAHSRLVLYGEHCRSTVVDRCRHRRRHF